VQIQSSDIEWMKQSKLLKIFMLLGFMAASPSHAVYRELGRLDRLPRPMNLDTRCTYRLRLSFGANTPLRYYMVDSMNGNSMYVNSLHFSLSYLVFHDIRDYGSSLFPAPYSAPDPDSGYQKAFYIDNSSTRFYLYEANGGVPLNMTNAFLEIDCGSSGSSSSAGF
jgi:hypothetical protein